MLPKIAGLGKYRRSFLAILAFVATPYGRADEPANPADAFLYYSRRPDPSGDVSGLLIQPSLSTGAAQTSIPIIAPRGTGDVEPSLALTYSSARGRSSAGVGWTLELSTIARSTKHGSDLAQEPSSLLRTFVLDGSELVPRRREADPFGCNAWRYHSRTERYQKIFYCPALQSRSGYWTVLDKDGTRRTYGKIPEANGKLTDRYNVTYEYYLDEVTDTHGLSWRVWYAPYGGGPAGIEAPYIDRLQYTFRDGASVGALREVAVQWERRPDGRAEWVDWRYGFPIAHDKRIEAIEVRLGGSRIRRYVLTYDANPNVEGEQFSADSRASMLRSVQMFGVTDADLLPAMTFDYLTNAGADSPGFESSPFGSPTFVGPAKLSEQGFDSTIIGDFIDLNGDGYLDWVDSSTKGSWHWRVRWGKGVRGFAAAAEDWPNAGHYIREIVPDGNISRLAGPDVANDILDMDGDGLPDEFRGGVLFQNTGRGFRGVPWHWPASNLPRGRVRDYDRTGSTGSDRLITTTWADLVDVTGDGCPDRLMVASGTWYYYRNLACSRSPAYGFDRPRVWRSDTPLPSYLGRSVSEAGYSQTSAGLLDFNGDGLIDFFYVDELTREAKFLMGTGRGFAAERGTLYGHSWSSIVTQPGALNIFPSFSSSFPDGWNWGFLDVNGDGRPDVVRSNADLEAYECRRRNRAENHAPYCSGCPPHSFRDAWRVWLNTGHGFGIQREGLDWQPINWKAHWANAEFGFLQASAPVGCYAAYGHTRVVDLDGSGTPDFVRVGVGANAGKWYLYRNRGPKPELLSRVSNGVGGRTELTYGAATGGENGGRLHFPVTVLRQSVTADGLYTVGPSATTAFIATFRYEHPYFDPVDRAFRGFGEVAVTHEDTTGSTEALFEKYTFAVGQVGRLIPVTPYPGCIEVWADHRALAGTEFGVKRGSAPARIYEERWQLWKAVAVPGHPGLASSQLQSTRHIEVDPLSAARRYRETQNEYGDAYGNITKTVNYGEVTAGASCLRNYAAGDDEVTISTAYAANPARWIVSLPSEVKTCADTACAKVLRHERFYYDGAGSSEAPVRGDKTETRTLVRFPGDPDLWTSSASAYDSYGNVTKARVQLTTSPAVVATTDFVYADDLPSTADSFAYPHKSVRHVTKHPANTPIDLVTLTDWDERFGIAIQRTDANGRRSITVPDGLGRIRQVSSTPPDTHIAAPVVLSEITYSLGGAVGSTTANWMDRVDHWGPGPVHTFQTRVYYDGLLRPVEEKKQAADGKWSTVARRYTGAGKPDIATLPYFEPTLEFTPFNFAAPTPVAAVKRAVYDWSGRELATSLRATDGMTYFAKQRVYYLWDETVRNTRGHETLYRHDAYDRVNYVEERDSSTPQAKTSYQYDRVGNLVGVTDNGGNVLSMSYDTRGLKRRMLDPDMSNCSPPGNCPWAYDYDLAGRMVKQVDAQGRQIEFSVDELGRVFWKHYACLGCGEEDAWFDYDAPGALGLIVGAIKGPGNLGLGGSVLTSANWSLLEYDNWGRVTSVRQSVAGDVRSTATAYDLLNRQTSVTYPTGEVASYVYGSHGAVERITFAGAPIVIGAQYDASARPTAIAWGNGLTTVTAFLPMQKVGRVAVGSLLNLSYTYDANGNTETMEESAQGWSRTFEYDWADRLLTAQEPASGVPAKVWSYAYDVLGNITYNSDWAVPGMDGSYVYGSVGGTGPAGPHAVTLIGGAAASTPYRLTYNANGGIASETTGRSYDYNFDNQIATAADSAASVEPNTSFTYDANGVRVRKTWTSQHSKLQDLRYFGPHLEELRSDGVLGRNRYVLLGSSRIALVPSDETSGAIYYLHPDVQGTVALVTDKKGAVVERQRFAPYGGPYQQTGNTPGLRYGYTGQEHDTESGQIHLGVRELNFAIGRFLTPDVIVPDLYRPQTLNRYSYAYNNPARYTDPSGFWAADDTSCEHDSCDGHLEQHTTLTAGGYIEIAAGREPTEGELAAFRAHPVLHSVGYFSAATGVLAGLGVIAEASVEIAAHVMTAAAGSSETHQPEERQVPGAAPGPGDASSPTGGSQRPTVQERATELQKLNGGRNSVKVGGEPDPTYKRVDLAGKSHGKTGGVPTPHTATWTKHEKPGDPTKVSYDKGPTVPATHEDLDQVERVLKGQKPQ